MGRRGALRVEGDKWGKGELKRKEAPQPTYMFHASCEKGSVTSCGHCKNNLHELTLSIFKAGPQRKRKLPPLFHVDLFQKCNTVGSTDVMPLMFHLSKNIKEHWDFPGGPVVKNPLTNTREMGLMPGQGRFHVLWGNQTHAPQLLILCSGACELQPLSPHALEPVLQNKRNHHNKDQPPLTMTRENP